MPAGTNKTVNRLYGPRGTRAPRRRRRGFTLVELLTVIIILGILIGLVSPSVQTVRRMFMVDQTRGYMHQLTMGIENYKTEIGELPPSDGGYGHPTNLTPPKLSSGAAGLVECMLGYMDSGRDGLDGPGFRVERAGKKHGPFVPQDMPLAGDPPTFQDAFGNTILYYRFDPKDKTYYASDNNIQNDNTSAKGPPGLMTYVRDPRTNDNTHPYYREDYLLLSPGPNRAWDTVGANTTKTDDIANFSFNLKESQP